MNILDAYTFELISALKKSGVEFLIVGGYAVNFHGFRRTTGDIDLWLRPDNQNKGKLLSAFKSIEMDEESLAAINHMDFTKPLVFSDGEEPFKIDFMTQVSGIQFDEAYCNKTIANLDGIELPFINLPDLIITKISSSRTKDTLDVEELQKIVKRITKI